MTRYPIPIENAREFKVYRDNSLFKDQKHLCMVAEELTTQWPEANMFHGLPWITPVMGSGSLDLGDGERIDQQSVREAAAQWFRGADGVHPDDLKAALPDDLDDVGDVAASFARDLEDDRRATHDDPSRAAEDLLEATPTTAALSLVTAVLTWLYHEVRMVSGAPTSRWWAREEAHLPTRGLEATAAKETAEAASRLIDQLLASEEEFAGPVTGAARSLLESIKAHLADGRVILDELRVLTEVSWLALVEGSSIYPGWSDLLLKLVIGFSDKGPPRGVHPDVRHHTELGERVRNLLLTPTDRSWKDHTRKQPRNARTRLYRAVAALLVEQAHIFSTLHPAQPMDDTDPELDKRFASARELVDSITQESRERISAFPEFRQRWIGDPEVPYPTCFVTSFDVEVEMALWAGNIPFRLVLPVLVVAPTGDSGELVWLTTEINPTTGSPRRLDHLLGGEGRCWEFASRVFEDPTGGDRPVVVRLTGTPLFDLPDFEADHDLCAELEKVVPAFERICHALTVDEYTSMRFSENEWFFAGQASMQTDQAPEPDAPRRRDLPSQLATGTRTNERFLVALGVQLDDPAIRSRMLSQFSVAAVARRIDEQGKSSPVTAGISDVLGIAVNRRMDEDEAVALHWLGFDLALDTDCGDLTLQLEHCTEHLRAVRGELDGRSRSSGTTARAAWARARSTTCRLWRKAP